MNTEIFIKSVEQMREAQKAYFKDRSPENLKRSIAKEREVDQMIKTKNQKTMFQ